VNSHQLVFLLLDLSVIVVLARLVGAVARRFDQPPVVGEVLLGIALGPTLLGTTFAGVLFPVDVRPFLTALANIGVAMFMFVVGLELDSRLLRGRGKVAVTVSLSSLVVPLGSGILLGFHLLRHHHGGSALSFVLFIGAAMSVTAFPVLARIVTDRGLARTSLGGIALAAAAMSDVLAWSLLAVVVVLSGKGGSTPFLIALVPLYVLVMFFGVRPLLRRILTPGGRLAGAQLAVVLGGVLLSGAATEWLGLHLMFGAFLFGIVMPRAGAEQVRATILDRVTEFNSALLLPVFFIVTGLQVDISGIGLSGLVDLGLVLLVAVTGKFGGAFAGARLQGLPARKSAALAVLMNTRGLTELIILSVGLQFGILDRSLYSIMVAMAVVTTALAGPLLRLIYPLKLVEIDRNRDDAPTRPADVNRRRESA
jgi:Kef-type K+ transport system membrane component KefB